jgi:hypothetical protein
MRKPRGHHSKVRDFICYQLNLTSLPGLRVAQVHVIFALPAIYCLQVEQPLAYVEWFTPFGNPDPLTGLYTISRSTRMGHTHSEIIDVSRIARNCHVIPKFGREKPVNWTSANVTHLCNSFFPNPYIDTHMFCTMKVGLKNCL